MLVNRDKYLQLEIDNKTKSRALTYKPNPKQINEGELVYVDNEGLYIKRKGQLKLILSVNGFKAPSPVYTSTITNANNYDIHISSFHQYYVDAESQTEGAGVHTGYWNYLINSFLDQNIPIMTPVTFKEVNKVKLSATITVGTEPVKICEFMKLKSNIPLSPIIYANSVIYHSIAIAKDTVWNNEVPDWHFLYKMEFKNIYNASNLEETAVVRVYDIPIVLNNDIIKAIRRFYTEGDPSYPYYNPIIILELVINVSK